MSPTWRTPADVPPIRRNEVHIWRAFLDVPPDFEIEGCLSIDEQQRANRYYHLRDRSRFVAGRAILRRILSRYVDDDPRNMRFTYGPRGKPALHETGPQPAFDLRFNVSHSGGLALYAFAAGRDIGIDVERVKHLTDAEDVAKRFFSDLEYGTIRGLSPGARMPAFFRCWTRKEAYVKALGTGLSHPLDTFDVLGTKTPNLLHDHCGSDSTWRLYDVHPAAGFMGAIAVEGEQVKLARFSFSDRVLIDQTTS